MSQGHKYAPPPGRGASVEAAGAVRSMCHALRIHPLGACPFSANRNHNTPKSYGTMHGKYCCKLQGETSAAAGAARLPRRARPRPGRGELRVRRWWPTSTTSRATRSAGTTRSTGSHREAHPADSGRARRGPARGLTRTPPRQFSPSRGAGAGQNGGSQPAGNARTPARRPGGRTWLERRLDGKRQHTVAEIAEAAGVHRTRPRNHRWAVPGIVPQHAFHDGRTEPIPVRQPTWPGARTASRPAEPGHDRWPPSQNGLRVVPFAGGQQRLAEMNRQVLGNLDQIIATLETPADPTGTGAADAR